MCWSTWGSCQDLAHLGSRQRVLPGSGSDVVFLSVLGKPLLILPTLKLWWHSSCPDARTRRRGCTPTLPLACCVILDTSPHLSVILPVIHNISTVVPTSSLCSQPVSGPICSSDDFLLGWLAILESNNWMSHLVSCQKAVCHYIPAYIWSTTWQALFSEKTENIISGKTGKHGHTKSQK